MADEMLCDRALLTDITAKWFRLLVVVVVVVVVGRKDNELLRIKKNEYGCNENWL